jgi:hypothetical protein
MPPSTRGPLLCEAADVVLLCAAVVDLRRVDEVDCGGGDRMRVRFHETMTENEVRRSSFLYFLGRQDFFVE